jgi:methyl-accepting chemotaxis protein
MAGLVSGLITSAVVKTTSDKLSSAITEQASLICNFSSDLVDMKDTMESMAAVLKDAEKQSVKESVRLWLNRLEHSALDISDMMDDYQDTETQTTEKVRTTSNRQTGSGRLVCRVFGLLLLVVI